jgi:hypothetical protein
MAKKPMARTMPPTKEAASNLRQFVDLGVGVTVSVSLSVDVLDKASMLADVLLCGAVPLVLEADVVLLFNDDCSEAELPVDDVDITVVSSAIVELFSMPVYDTLHFVMHTSSSRP